MCLIVPPVSDKNSQPLSKSYFSKEPAMKDQDKTTRGKFDHLRKRAEKLLKNPGVLLKSYDAVCPATENKENDLENPLKLIHELQTFQIELELQNEELLLSQQELMDSRARPPAKAPIPTMGNFILFFTNPFEGSAFFPRPTAVI